ncbi:TPA: hypothetical protein ACXZW1_002293 [Salmonella enterica]
MEPISIAGIAQAAGILKTVADALNSIKKFVKGDNSLSEKITTIENQLLEARNLFINSQQVIIDLQNLYASEHEESIRLRKELSKLKSSLRDTKNMNFLNLFPVFSSLRLNLNTMPRRNLIAFAQIA